MYVFMYVYVTYKKKMYLCMRMLPGMSPSLAKRVKQKTNNYGQSHDAGFCIL